MRRGSIRGRMLAGVVGAQLVLAAGLVWAGIAFTHRQLRQAFDTALAGRATAVSALVRYPESGPGLRFDVNLARELGASLAPPPLYQVRGPAGVVANTFPAGVALPAPPPRARYWNFRDRGAGYRGLVLAHLPVLDTEEHMPVPLPQLTVYYAAPTAAMTRATAVAGAAIAAISLALLALTTWLAAGVIGRELTPLRTLAAQAAAISPRQGSFTPPARAAAELQPLIAALARMLERLHEAGRQQRDFLADTAHHLKTPVAIIKSTQQTLLQRPRDAAEYRAAAEATLQDTERLEHLLQRMLRLAQLDAHLDAPGTAAGAPPPPRSEAGATLAAALERTRPLAAARQVELRTRGLEAMASVQVEAEDLELVWVNLLENAIQHSPPGSAVEVDCANGPDSLSVAVHDQGCGIPPEELPKIFDRFRRGPESSGFGLGLAIARAIVEAGGGHIRASSSPAGTIMAVQLPPAAS